MNTEYIQPAYSENIMQKVREYLGLEPYDTSRDAEINSLTKNEVFGKVLIWEGIIGYEYQIKRWIEDIYGVQLN